MLIDERTKILNEYSKVYALKENVFKTYNSLKNENERINELLLTEENENNRNRLNKIKKKNIKKMVSYQKFLQNSDEKMANIEIENNLTAEEKRKAIKEANKEANKETKEKESKEKGKEVEAKVRENNPKNSNEEENKKVEEEKKKAEEEKKKAEKQRKKNNKTTQVGGKLSDFVEAALLQKARSDLFTAQEQSTNAKNDQVNQPKVLVREYNG